MIQINEVVTYADPKTQLFPFPHFIVCNYPKRNAANRGNSCSLYNGLNINTHNEQIPPYGRKDTKPLGFKGGKWWQSLPLFPLSLKSAVIPIAAQRRKESNSCLVRFSFWKAVIPIAAQRREESTPV